MTRDEGTSAWYRKTHAAVKRQPRFVTPGGKSVQAISLDSRPVFKIMNGSYLVAYAKDITEAAQYVDLSELQEEKK